ncbi:MAG: hypothetical protein NTV04_18235, partial [Deltaproteobacteria bacterium]|nr:hypothetical protein [Deltaproteobacteria bacterium]
ATPKMLWFLIILWLKIAARGSLESLAPFTLNHCFGKNASIGRGDGGAIRGSTGREFPFHRQSQKRYPKERRKACGPALNHGKTTALWFREARRCPRAPPGAPKYLIPLVFRKSEGGQAEKGY